MKIGVICEGPNTDKPVLEVILPYLFPATEFQIYGADSKAVIYRDIDIHLMNLERDGVQRSLVIWDLDPPGHQMPIPAQRAPGRCQYEQRQTLLKQLCQSGHLSKPLHQQALHHATRYGFPPYNEHPAEPPDGNESLFALVCVPSTMESWFLADGGLLTELASTKVRPADRWNRVHPDQIDDPVARLIGYFRRAPNNRWKYYNKHTDNKKLAEAYRDSGRINSMRKSQSFSRMVELLQNWGAK